MSERLKQAWREWRTFVVFLFLILFFRSAFADWYIVPTSSMQPTILVGDRIFVNKLAYDLRVPFFGSHITELGEPERGDIVVFESESADDRLVKRVIGLPGDVVELVENQLIVNGDAVTLEPLDLASEVAQLVEPTPHERLLVEDLSRHPHVIRLDGGVLSRLSNFGPVSVPEDHFLVLGDNRDHSADSRVYGFVPREELVGRAERVIVSLDQDDHYLPRSGRFFYPLQ